MTHSVGLSQYRIANMKHIIHPNKHFSDKTPFIATYHHVVVVATTRQSHSQ
jgi:hypothetical protein